MNTKHTPGEWTICRNGRCKCRMVWGDKGTVCVAATHGTHWQDSIGDPWPSDEEAEANARLIAAAPKLLEALKAAVERMEAVSEHLPVEKRAEGVSQAAHVQHLAGHLYQHAKIARAAIAKATGEEP